MRLRYPRELRDDADELTQLLIPLPAAEGGMGEGAVPLAALLAPPTVLDLRFDGVTPEAWRAAQPLVIGRNLTVLGPDRAELVVGAGDREPAIAGGARIAGRRAAVGDLTWTIGPMAIRGEDGRRIQYVLLNARDRAEVDVVRDADQTLRAAIGRGELPPLAYRWVGRFEQKMKADRTLTWVIGIALAVMLLLILIGTRSALVTAIIVSCNVTVTCAGGFIAVHLAGAEMTTAVIVGFLVLLGVMFNDGILLGSFLHDQFETPATSVAEVRRRVFLAALRRRRPAIMTNCTTLLSLIPVLWSDGRGAELMRPMVLPVIGGMIADYLSLFSVPVVYAWWRERQVARRGATSALSDEPPPAPAV